MATHVFQCNATLIVLHIKNNPKSQPKRYPLRQTANHEIDAYPWMEHILSALWVSWLTCFVFVAMRCDPPPAQGGITITGLPENEEGILPDHFLKFSCDLPGKQLSGSSLLVCGQDGVWDQPFPSCEGSRRTLTATTLTTSNIANLRPSPAPTDISCQVEELHLHLTAAELPPGNKTIRTGHKLRFRCGDGYALVGAEEIECLPTGQWNKLFPTCTGMLLFSPLLSGM